MSMTPEVVKMIFEKACLTKANLTEEIANCIVDKAAKDGLLLYYYKCMFCGSYHMTRKPGGVENHLELQ